MKLKILKLIGLHKFRRIKGKKISTVKKSSNWPFHLHPHLKGEEKKMDGCAINCRTKFYKHLQPET